MFSFFFLDQNLWFSIAVGIVISLFVLELLGVLFGLSLLSFLDDISPIEVGADANVEGGVASSLSWLCLDRLPLMVWLILFLTLFGLSGYLFNFASGSLMGSLPPTAISLVAAIIIGLFLTARLGSSVAKLLPKQESSAMHEYDFEGLTAEIVLGVAKPGSPAEAKCIDQFNQAHYLLAEPIEAEEVFNQGDTVILVKKGPNCWLATRYI